MPGNLRVRALLDAVPRDTKVLDVGCVQHSADKAANDDWVHGQLYDIAAEVVGLDYENAEVERLRDSGYNVVHGDAENLDLDEQFDVVVAGELIEHLSNVGSFLDGAHKHLRPDGELIITTPIPWAFHRFKQAVFGGVYCNEEHTCWFDARTLRQLFARHDLEVVELEHVKASDPGITSALYRAGFEALGGTSVLVRAKPDG
jgi:2-polyprenyl-3-methyl-5-hydroxy-6-metoxy-1,4-benzoquinol methylase